MTNILSAASGMINKTCNPVIKWIFQLWLTEIYFISRGKEWGCFNIRKKKKTLRDVAVPVIAAVNEENNSLPLPSDFMIVQWRLFIWLPAVVSILYLFSSKEKYWCNYSIALILIDQLFDGVSFNTTHFWSTNSFMLTIVKYSSSSACGMPSTFSTSISYLFCLFFSLSLFFFVFSFPFFSFEMVFCCVHLEGFCL